MKLPSRMLFIFKKKVLVESEEERSKADEHYEDADEVDEHEKKVLQDLTNA